jgi:hypothetical protein
MREWIRGPVMDSQLYVRERSSTRNADLVFILSVHLNRYDPDSSGLYADDNGGVTQIQRWTDAEWQAFRQGFWRTVTNYWNNRFWLIPPDGYEELDWPAGFGTHRPNVKCGLKLSVHQTPEHARIAINCVRPIGDGGFRSSMSARSGELDIADLDPLQRQATATETQTQTVVLHEVGHLLGLDHVSPNAAACTAANAPGCYGTTAWQRGDLMGWGQRLEPWHSWPWRDRIRYHTGRGGWRVTMTRPAPVALAPQAALDAGVIRDAGVMPAGTPNP